MPPGVRNVVVLSGSKCRLVCREVPRPFRPMLPSAPASLPPHTPVGPRLTSAPYSKSDLRNHQAIVQPRLYDCLMVTQITLKTEGPHGLPSGRQTEVDPLYRGLIILTVYDCGHAFQSLERSEPMRERIDSRGRRVAALH